MTLCLLRQIFLNLNLKGWIYPKIPQLNEWRYYNDFSGPWNVYGPTSPNMLSLKEHVVLK